MPWRKAQQNVPDVLEEWTQKETLLNDLVFDKGGSNRSGEERLFKNRSWDNWVSSGLSWSLKVTFELGHTFTKRSLKSLHHQAAFFGTGRKMRKTGRRKESGILRGWHQISFLFPAPFPGHLKQRQTLRVLKNPSYHTRGKKMFFKISLVRWEETYRMICLASPLRV